MRRRPSMLSRASLTSNHMFGLVQFGINKHLKMFQRLLIALTLRAREKFTLAHLFQIALEIMGLPFPIDCWIVTLVTVTTISAYILPNGAKRKQHIWFCSWHTVQPMVE